MTSKRVPSIVLGVAAVAFLVLAIVLVSLFPAVEGLGTKVRLPVFHGALTWANLTTFSIMALLALIFVLTKRDGVYRFESGDRWVSVPLWLVGSGMGLMAALGTWDLSGSRASVVSVVTADPRLMAQFWIVLLAILLLLLPLFVDDRRYLAVGDIAFVSVMWIVLLRAILGPGRALHPDSPVMNSSEFRIKALFIGIYVSLTVAALLSSWLVSRYVGAHERAMGEAHAAEALAES